MILRLSCVHMIWSQGPHNAFSDLSAGETRILLCFREGSGHARPGHDPGLASGDGENGSRWCTEMEGYDLRRRPSAVTPA